MLDDSHDEGGETLTLSNASSGRLMDAEATRTTVNLGSAAPGAGRAFGWTAAVHVVEHVEERMAAPREPGFRGQFAGASYAGAWTATSPSAFSVSSAVRLA